MRSAMHLDRQKTAFGLTALGALAAVTWADAITGAQVSVLAFYVAPVAIATFGLGLSSGVAFAAAAGCSVYLTNFRSELFAEHHGVLAWNSVMCMVTLVIVACGLRAVKELADDLIGERGTGKRRSN